MKKKPSKPLIGRPPKPRGEKYRTTARILGRVPDDEWSEIKGAADAAQQTFTQWAVSNLLILARGGKILPPDA